MSTPHLVNRIFTQLILKLKRVLYVPSEGSISDGFPKKVLTLCVIYDDSRILLGMKKRGFGAGRWNGFGGKIKDDETIEAAALRELEEEVGLIPRDMEKRGVVTFVYNDDQTAMEVHIFSVTLFDGESAESDEMLPKWFAHNEIPFDQMWPDDKYWMPLFLAGKNFEGKFVFSDKNTIIDHKLEEI